MHPRDLAVIGVRLIAVYTLIPAFSAASYLLLGRTVMPPVPVVPQAVFIVLLSAALWLSAPAIGGALSSSHEALQGLGLDLRSLAQVGFGAVGLVLVVQAALGFARSAAVLITFQATQAAQGVVVQNPGPPPVFVGELVGAVVQILLGVAVFLGRRSLARALAAARNYCTAPASRARPRASSLSARGDPRTPTPGLPRGLGNYVIRPS